MQVENTEINGFVIDKFNQHDLAVGKTQGTCPLCSHNRKPKNQKKQCASYDWERGLGTCHNCNETFQLHTYERKGKSDKEYAKPDSSPQVVQYNSELSDKVLKWFESRGISPQTLDYCNVTETKEWMPQTGKDENTIRFNYYMGNELITVSYTHLRAHAT